MQLEIYPHQPGTVGNMSDCRSRGGEFDPPSPILWEIDHEIISRRTMLAPCFRSNPHLICVYLYFICMYKQN